MNKQFKLFVAVIVLWCTQPLFAQVWSDSLSIYFKPYENHTLAFDEQIPSKKVSQLPIQHLAIEKSAQSKVLFVVNDSSRRNFSKWKFSADFSEELLSFQRINDSTFSVQLPENTISYTVTAFYASTPIIQMEVIPLEQKSVDVVLVPLVNRSINADALQSELTKIYQQANVSFSVSVFPTFRTEEYNSKTQFANPILEHKRYTQQMRSLRDAFFKANKKLNKSAYYVFVVDGFLDTTLTAYMPRNKAFALVKHTNSSQFYYTIARELGFGAGSFSPFSEKEGVLLGTTQNVMDTTGGYGLNAEQWQLLQQSSQSFQFYDEDENVRTNNGLVAYYFWEEDKDGFIQLDGRHPLATIHRPYKKNYRSYHLNIEDYFFQTLFKVFGYRISLWHMIGLFSVVLLWWFTRRYLKRKMTRPGNVKNYWRFPVKVVSLFSFSLLYVLLFMWLNAQLTKYEVRSGKIKDFKNFSYTQVRKSILSNKELAHENEDALTSQLMIKRQEDWYFKERKHVLYFSVYQDENKNWSRAKFSHDADSLILSTENFRELAESHYIVYNYVDSIGEYAKQRVFNHVGIEITKKLAVVDDAKRVLVFVNGYRPTSIGKTFEDNFADIQKYGLEHPDSKNLIYEFDRYDYWRPWREIDLLFQKRINPTVTYYADGHHSVSTSNHRSLIKFSSNSRIYPKRCADLNNHTCHKTEISVSGVFGSTSTVETKALLATDPNEKGFNYRKNQGKIAGKNLLMMLNEFPSRIMNDTLYLVAHSMGYAYSIGMLDELRGKINFGAFYIIAPENAESGTVNLDEWRHVWHYGSNLIGTYPDYPCLQDGVAPQSKVDGLGRKEMVFIPSTLAPQMGYFDSHFIGYYTWIFDIQQNHKGHILQR